MSYVRQNNQTLMINKEVEHTFQYIKNPPLLQVET